MVSSRRILVTGADGFVGRHVCRHLAGLGWSVRGSRRLGPAEFSGSIEYRPSGDIADRPDWRPLLDGVSVVVHTAGRAHARVSGGEDPLTACRQVNVVATEHLARAAAASGVKRFIHVSSLLAETVSSEVGKPSADRLRPYPLSKREAESALARVAGEVGMEIVILRAPLVYGPGVPANFRLLMRAVAGGWPLPLASVENRRSFIFVGNLTDCIAAAAGRPRPFSGLFAVSDGEAVSVPHLARLLADAIGRKPRLLPFPPGLLRAGAAVLGQSERAESLLGSLVADDRAFRDATGWSPPFTLAEGLAATVKEVRLHDRT